MSSDEHQPAPLQAYAQSQRAVQESWQTALEHASHSNSSPSSAVDATEHAAKRAHTAQHTDAAAYTAAASMSSYSGFGAQMLQRMGYREGGVLGRSQQQQQQHALTAPLEVEQRLGRHGLGHADTVVANAHTPWEERDASLERSIVHLDVPREELPGGGAALCENDIRCSSGAADAAAVQEGVCDEALRVAVERAKTELDALTDQRRFRSARARASPYEAIGRAVFQNRAALKLAELDAVMGVAERVPLLPDENNVLFFADVCAGPGGFTEYLYWRRKWRARGWGLTLVGPHDFQLDKVNAECAVESFEAVRGPRGDGDVMREENLRALQSAVRAGTPGGRGVALLVADGGISTDGVWNKQEALTKRLVMCQFAAALMCVREGGTFVCKLFDVFSPFVCGCIAVLCSAFERVEVCKPVQSRPANSERYVVCSGLRQRDPPEAEHLLRVNRRFDALGAGGDIVSIVPDAWLRADGALCACLRASNESIARLQVVALGDIARYYKSPNLAPPADQDQVRRDALARWHVPESVDELRTPLPFNAPCAELARTMQHALADGDAAASPAAGLVSRRTLGRWDAFPFVRRPLHAALHNTLVLSQSGPLALLVAGRDGVVVLDRALHVAHRAGAPFVPKGTVLAGEYQPGANGAPGRFAALDALCLAGVPLVPHTPYEARLAFLGELLTALGDGGHGGDAARRVTLTLKPALPFARMAEVEARSLVRAHDQAHVWCVDAPGGAVVERQHGLLFVRADDAEFVLGTHSSAVQFVHRRNLVMCLLARTEQHGVVALHAAGVEHGTAPVPATFVAADELERRIAALGGALPDGALRAGVPVYCYFDRTSGRLVPHALAPHGSRPRLDTLEKMLDKLRCVAMGIDLHEIAAAGAARGAATPRAPASSSGANALSSPGGATRRGAVGE